MTADNITLHVVILCSFNFINKSSSYNLMGDNLQAKIVLLNH